MSGEAAPRHIIRSQVTMKPYGEVSTIMHILQHSGKIPIPVLCTPAIQDSSEQLAAVVSNYF